MIKKIPPHCLPETYNPWPWIIFGIAFVLNLVYFLQLRATPYFNNLFLDPGYYWRWGQIIAAGEWLGKEPFEMSPLYPYLLGMYQRFLGQNLALIRIIQISLGSLIPVMTYYLGKKLFNQPIGIIAGLILSLYKPLLFYNNMVMKTWLAPFFCVATVLTLSSIQLDSISVFAAGIIWGLLCLVQENQIVAVPLILIWLIGNYRTNWYRFSIIFTLGYLLAISPATIHNYLASKEFIPITSGAGEVFFIGSMPENTGEYRVPSFVRADPLTEHEDFRQEAKRRTRNPNLTRKEVSDFWYKEGLKQVQMQPLVYLKNMAHKLFLFWNAYEIPDNQSIDFMRNSLAMLKWPLVTFGMLAPLGLLGMGWQVCQEKKITLSMFLILGAWLAVAPFYVYARFRLIIIPLLAVGAAFAIYNLFLLFQEKMYKKNSILLIILMLLLVFCNLPSGLDKKAHLAIAQANLGTLYYREGKNEQAIKELTAALGLDPFNEVAYRYLTLIYTKESRYEEALATLNKLRLININQVDYHLLKAEIYKKQGDLVKLKEEYLAIIQLEPHDFSANFTLGALLGQAGDYAAAIKHLEIANQINPNDYSVTYNLGLAYEKLGKAEKSGFYSQKAAAIKTTPTR